MSYLQASTGTLAQPAHEQLAGASDPKKPNTREPPDKKQTNNKPEPENNHPTFLRHQTESAISYKKRRGVDNTTT